MLAPADAAIVARDPAIPGLALVLDPDALSERLARARPDRQPVVAEATYVRYKPGTSCLVGYRLDHVHGGNGPDGEWPGGDGPDGDGPVFVFAKAYRHGDGAKLAKARRKAEDGAVSTFGPELVVVAGAAADRDLPGARRLHDDGAARHLHGAGGDARPGDPSRSRRHRLLRRLLPASPDLWSATPRVLRYKPERRWVGLVERGEEGPVALVKAYRSQRLPAAAAGLRFATRASCGSPRLLGTAAKAGALASSWVPGVALSDVLTRSDRPHVPLAEVGAAVAALHQADPSGLAPVRPDADARAVAAAASHVARVLPTSGPPAANLAASLARQLDGGSRPLGARHGDFSPDQVVCGPAGVSLVDFDDVAVGDVAADLGHFTAALVAAELDGGLEAGTASALAEELLCGYAAAGGSPCAELVATHTALALVRLAVEPFRLRQPDWPARTEELLREAQTWSASGAVPC